MNQLLGLGIGRGAVIAGLGHLHLVGYHGVAQLLYARHDRIGHVDGVFSGLFGNAQSDRRVFTAAVLFRQPLPHITCCRQRAVFDNGDIAQKHGAAIAHADNQFSDVLGAFQKRA